MILTITTLLLAPALAAIAEEGGFGSFLRERDGEKHEAKTKKKSEKKKRKEAEHKEEAKAEPKAARTEKASENTATKAEIESPAPSAVRAPSSDPSPFKFGAFADFRYTQVSEHNDPNIANANAESGFGLEDAALYANYDKDKVSVVADLAFRRAKDKDFNSAATTPEQSSNANFSLGLEKSQLYAKYRIIPELAATLGQFDTIFGVEVNDSKDRVFGRTGLVYEQALPVTHAGFMLDYARSGFAAKAFVANPGGKGSRGTSTAGDDHEELAGSLGYSNEWIRGQAAYITRKIQRAVGGVNYGRRSVTDLILGTTLGGFSFDLEAAFVSDANKNTLTSTDSADLENAGQAYMVLASYRVIEPLLLGARYEWTRNDPSAQSIDRGTAAGFSVHYRLAPELELRSEYVDYQFKNLTGTKWNASRFNLAAVLTF